MKRRAKKKKGFGMLFYWKFLGQVAIFYCMENCAQLVIGSYGKLQLITIR